MGRTEGVQECEGLVGKCGHAFNKQQSSRFAMIFQVPWVGGGGGIIVCWRMGRNIV